jgi:hypothetical protein
MKNIFKTVVILSLMLNFSQSAMAQGAPDLTGRSSNPSLSAGASGAPDLTGRGNNRAFLVKDRSKMNSARRGPDLTGQTTNPQLGKIPIARTRNSEQGSGWRVSAILLSLAAILGVVAGVMKSKRT